jgi:hypothetical protein
MPYLIFEHPSHPEEPPEGPSFKRLFGRTSAWACTTLYLTSRLPQIWKNVRLRLHHSLHCFISPHFDVGPRPCASDDEMC